MKKFKQLFNEHNMITLIMIIMATWGFTTLGFVWHLLSQS
jgi:hypothetical protein